MIKKDRRQLLVFIIFFIFCLAFIGNCFAARISARELITNAAEYDTENVVYEGELIGEPLERKEGTWVNVHDGVSAAIGIWLPKDIVFTPGFSGGYNVTGDYLRISGRFNRSCLMHGGDLDIHASSIKQLELGERREEKLDIEKKKKLFILSGILLCLLPILIISNKRQNKV